MQQITVKALEEYEQDNNNRTLDILLSLYLEFVEFDYKVPPKLKALIHGEIEKGHIVKELKVKRGRDADVELQQVMCWRVFSEILHRHHDGLYTEKLTLNKVVEHLAKDSVFKTPSALYKCLKKHGSIAWETFQWNITNVRIPAGAKIGYEVKPLTPSEKQLIEDMCRSYIFRENE